MFVEKLLIVEKENMVMVQRMMGVGTGLGAVLDRLLWDSLLEVVTYL